MQTSSSGPTRPQNIGSMWFQASARCPALLFDRAAWSSFVTGLRAALPG